MNILSLIDLLPQWLFVLMYPIPPLLLLWVIHRMFQRYAPHWKLEDRDENMAAGGIASAAALTGIVLAFVLALANQPIDNYQSEVSVEASQIRNLDTLLVATHGDSVEDCRKKLLDYTKSIVNDEWTQLTAQKGSPQTSKLLAKLDTCILSIDRQTQIKAAMYLEVVKLSSQITQSRESRISNSQSSLPPLFWFVMHLGLLLTIVLSALSFYTPGKIRVINCSIQIITLCILMALILILDHPFSGSNGISNQPIKDLISHLETKPL